MRNLLGAVGLVLLVVSVRTSSFGSIRVYVLAVVGVLRVEVVGVVRRIEVVAGVVVGGSIVVAIDSTVTVSWVGSTSGGPHLIHTAHETGSVLAPDAVADAIARGPIGGAGKSVLGQATLVEAADLLLGGRSGHGLPRGSLGR